MHSIDGLEALKIDETIRPDKVVVSSRAGIDKHCKHAFLLLNINI